MAVILSMYVGHIVFNNFSSFAMHYETAVAARNVLASVTVITVVALWCVDKFQVHPITLLRFVQAMAVILSMYVGHIVFNKPVGLWHTTPSLVFASFAMHPILECRGRSVGRYLRSVLMPDSSSCMVACDFLDALCVTVDLYSTYEKEVAAAAVLANVAVITVVALWCVEKFTMHLVTDSCTTTGSHTTLRTANDDSYTVVQATPWLPANDDSYTVVQATPSLPANYGSYAMALRQGRATPLQGGGFYTPSLPHVPQPSVAWGQDWE
ncbi:hypothetical protein T484DRAFT_1754947 [Baffinella frigidus]|nr:hypothetical protein T484DRAFT_1754947 [Cryptophyta sp. CCMP2293]